MIRHCQPLRFGVDLAHEEDMKQASRKHSAFERHRCKTSYATTLFNRSVLFQYCERHEKLYLATKPCGNIVNACNEGNGDWAIRSAADRRSGNPPPPKDRRGSCIGGPATPPPPPLLPRGADQNFQKPPKPAKTHGSKAWKQANTIQETPHDSISSPRNAIMIAFLYIRYLRLTISQ